MVTALAARYYIHVDVNCTGHQWLYYTVSSFIEWVLLSSAKTTLRHTADYNVAMEKIIADSEKEFAVIKFHVDDKYTLPVRNWNKAADSAGFFVGEEVTIQWSKHEVYKGIVVFTNGNPF